MAAYTPTVWANDKAPALSAANLNNLTNELEAQALEAGVIHTLPNWADGAVPALTDLAPWNEMERVLAAVAASEGLSYTVTVWQAGWVPTRNAYRLNRMEAQAAVNRTALDATTTGSPLGFLSHRSPGFFPPTNVDKYNVVITDGPPPAAFTGVGLKYFSAVTAHTDTNKYGTNITGQEALASGFVLRDASDNILTNYNHGGYLCDPGLPAYQARHCEYMLGRIQQLGNTGGFWIDDSGPRFDMISGPSPTGGPWPAKYPNKAAYEVALLSYAAYVKSFCDANGVKCAYNTYVVLDNNASLTKAWIARIGPHSHYITIEYWLTPGTFTRLTGVDQWWKYWDEYRQLHTACQTAGTGFLPLNVARAQVYGLASFLLDWNGTGCCMWTPAGYVSPADPWIPEYTVAAQLGAPLGVATKTGNVWTRQFAGGTVTVDPTLGTATIT